MHQQQDWDVQCVSSFQHTGGKSGHHQSCFSPCSHECLLLMLDPHKSDLTASTAGEVKGISRVIGHHVDTLSLILMRIQTAFCEMFQTKQTNPVVVPLMMILIIPNMSGSPSKTEEDTSLSDQTTLPLPPGAAALLLTSS